MVLSDRDILGRMSGGGLEIRDPHPEIIQPASVDLHLGRRIRTITSTLIDPMKQTEVMTEALVMDGGWVLNPGSFLLGCTQEWVRLPTDLVAIVTGKSSLARIGLQVEAAGYVDAGWMGNLTLELYNMGPAMIILRPGMDICQLRFERMSSPSLHVYGDSVLRSHYQGSVGVVPARFRHRPSHLVGGQDVALVGQDKPVVPSVLGDELGPDAVDPLL